MAPSKTETSTDLTALDLQRALQQTMLDGLRPLCAGLSPLFAVFIVFNLLDLPPAAKAPVVAHDAILVVLFALLWSALKKRLIKPRWAAALCSAVALLVLSNVILTFALTGRTLYTFYVAIIAIGAGGFLLSSRWLAMTLTVTGLSWAQVAWAQAPREGFVHFAFIMLGGVTLGLSLHFARVRSAKRLEELRLKDAQRKRELEQALGLAERAREVLDIEVEERTAQLRLANTDLTREIEERQHAELERLRLEESLAQSQKMEAVGRLAGGVAHDFNNLLTVILGNLDLAIPKVESGTVAHECLEEVRGAAQQAASVTRQLLAFSRKQVLERHVVDLVGIVTGMENLLRRVIGEHIELNLDLRQPQGLVRADPAQLETVIMNLAANGRDAMSGGGRLVIEVGEVAIVAGDEGASEDLPPGDYISLAVSDTGDGMDEVTLRSIFDPFFTTKEVGKGTGLGLATVYGIVAQHDGDVRVTSTPGVGATFTVLLPRVDYEARTYVVDEQVERDGSGGRTVLLVEDDGPVRRLAHTMLSGMGYEVLEAAGGDEALSLSRGHGGKIDLLVTDVVMPIMNGKELADRLCDERTDMAVLYASGYDDQVVSLHVARGEGVNFIQKPYTSEQLSISVARALKST